MKRRRTFFVTLAAVFCVPVISCTSSGGNSPTTSNDEGKTTIVPPGMKMVWNDEFNERKLDTSKWFTNYYSSLDYYYRTNFDDFKADNLPQPAILFTDTTIILRTNDQIPERTFWESGRKISSIQTYDWLTDKSLMDNRLGGYFETRIRRSATPDAEMANSAFWFDSPGPDLRYYFEQGTVIDGVEGIRPRGQVFEIDLCEYVTTEIVLHGNVSPKGEFQRNIGHFIIPGQYNNKWTKHGMLWTPAGLKFYVDDKLVAESWNPKDIKSPNHTMNMFFGAYGKGGEVDMEVDYVRYYQWQLEPGNEIPNPGFEYHTGLFPWEGKGTVSPDAALSGEYGVRLDTSNNIYQYVYLEHSQDYIIKFHSKGAGNIRVTVNNITPVTGASEDKNETVFTLNDTYSQYQMPFKTKGEHADHLKTVRVTFANESGQPIQLDDVEIVKSTNR